MSQQERNRLIRTYGHLYSRHMHHSVARHECFYCGEPANALDHCPPLASIEGRSKNYWKKNKIKFLLVPSCTNCNSKLGNREFFSLYERCQYLESKLLSDYEKIHNNWTDEEIEELGYTLKVSVKAYVARSQILLERIRHIQDRMLNHESFPTEEL